MLTGAAVAFEIRVPTVGGMGDLPTPLPVFGIPAVPFSLETLQIVAPYAIFASANALVHEFDLTDPTPNVVIDLTRAEVWDSSAVAILDAVVARYAARGVNARIDGLTDHSAELHGRLTGQLLSSH